MTSSPVLHRVLTLRVDFATSVTCNSYWLVFAPIFSQRCRVPYPWSGAPSPFPHLPHHPFSKSDSLFGWSCHGCSQTTRAKHWRNFFDFFLGGSHLSTSNHAQSAFSVHHVQQASSVACLTFFRCRSFCFCHCRYCCRCLCFFCFFFCSGFFFCSCFHPRCGRHSSGPAPQSGDSVLTSFWRLPLSTSWSSAGRTSWRNSTGCTYYQTGERSPPHCLWASMALRVSPR